MAISLPRPACLFVLYALLTLAACGRRSEADRIIDQTIATHGGDQFEHARIAFDFRQYHYQVATDNGLYTYERTFDDSAGRVHDVLTNATFVRKINDQPVTLTQKKKTSYTNSVNSVVYFALLPYKLNDPAVMKRYVGKVNVEGKPYHKIEVSFRAEGGGKDYRDVFYYWIHRQNHTMDYLAYSEEGPRFRKAINPRVVNGIRFADYINYEGPAGDTTSVQHYDAYFQQGKLKVLSRIELKNIRVN